MEETGGELGTSAPGAAASNRNSDLVNKDKPSKTREEGELTSSDEDAPPLCSGGQLTNASTHPSNSVPSAPVRTYAQNLKSGKSISSISPAGSTDIPSHKPIQSGHHRGFFKKKVPFKSTNPGWISPFGMDNNLVIRFSDEDNSDSDTDQQRQEKAPETNTNLHVVNMSKKPPDLPSVKFGNLRKTTRNEGKVLPKVSSNRSFISSMLKARGGSSRSLGSSLAQQRSYSKNSNFVNRCSTTYRDCGKSVVSNNSKLQDLRQLIAIRENELKLKTAQQNREIPSESCRDLKVMNQNKAASRKSQTISVDLPCGTREPDRKRLKITQNNSGQPSSGGQEKYPMESRLGLKEPGLEKSGSIDRSVVDHACHGREIPENELPLRSLGIQIQDQGPCVTANSSLSATMARPRVTLVTSNPDASLANSTVQTSYVEKLKHPSKVNGSHRAALENNITKSNDHFHDAVSEHDKLKSTSDGSLPTHSVMASPDNTSLLNCLGGSTTPVCGDTDLQSLLEIEEKHDKELEEAQEHRRRCEIEERNALRAYRKAQRALAEANAQCTYLYRRRELYAAQFRSLLLDDSNLLWSRQHGQIGDEWNPLNSFSEVNADQIPTSSHLMQAGFHAGNRLGYDSNIQTAEGDAQNRYSPNVEGQTFGSEAYSEPDASTSNLLPHKDNGAANEILSPSNDPNVSAYEDEETFPFDHTSGQTNSEFLKKENDFKERQKNLDGDPTMNHSLDGSRDSLLLEAELRSKLVSRLSTITSSQGNAGSDNREATVVRTADDNIGIRGTQLIGENILPSDPDKTQAPGLGTVYVRVANFQGAAEVDVGNMKTRIIMGNGSVSYPKKSQITDFEGSQNREGNASKLSFAIQNKQQVEERSLNHSPDLAAGTEVTVHSIASTGGRESTSIGFSSSILRSVFCQIKAASSICLNHVLTMNQHTGIYDVCASEMLMSSNDSHQLSVEREICISEVVRNGPVGGSDSYACCTTINPFWPLCMYELRGKCNNEECPWQHLKDSKINVNHDGSASADCQVGFSSKCEKLKDEIEFSSDLIPPTYLLFLDTVKAVAPSYRYQPSWKFGPIWGRVFSICLAVTSSIQIHPPSDEPFLHGNYSCVEIRGNYNRQPLYFQSINNSECPCGSDFTDNDQSLEMALLTLILDVNKVEGVKKSLSVLSRALEADPTSLCLWIVYLLIFYSKAHGDSIDEDDLFSCAVKHNKLSYELWLMYINSCKQLNDRFAAYEKALSFLCSCPPCDGDLGHASACILDLFLQMLNCFSISGNVAKAIERIYGLLHVERDSDEFWYCRLSDILPCLTIPDKCIFWVCCVYVVIYGKLPDKVVQQFEYKKESSLVLIEWPHVHVRAKDKEQLYKLIEMALESIELDLDSVSLENRSDLRSFHLFAVNHVKLVAATDGAEGCRNLLEKYTSQYPSCLELVLLLARTRGWESEGRRFLEFKERLRNWPNAVPGIQCIWNQYAEFAFHNGRSDQAKEIMVQWFNSVCKSQCFEGAVIDDGNGDSKNGVSDPSFELSIEALLSNSNKSDLTFGLLNLSLYWSLENDLLKAHLAVEEALKVAGHEDFKHCVSEHATFLLNYGSLLGKDVSVTGLPDILRSYLGNSCDFPSSDPLPRKFIQDIQKPRLRQLVSYIITPISPDFSTVNLVLEIWFGPSLLPQKFNKMKDLVDFVEAILEVSPSNYTFAISVCKLLSAQPDAIASRSSSISFWASSLLVNTIYQAMPVAPEYVWVEAAGLLANLTTIKAVSESFHRRALSVYPFSIGLWKSFLNTPLEPRSKRWHIVEAARERGIVL
ncbi:hypothetical protein Nepgr_012543 [Nepenthes gracilis]|uniref:Putative zinc-finger domain-containing protein n=1 Tax=Nepenthes gracilis TaxID=150966 RepID=A0AAD3SGA9_NEPGR|nr:hypothetical protein Nepgr_012543 [Nepenthes gracilis]